MRHVKGVVNGFGCEWICLSPQPSLDDRILALSKLKAFADDKFSKAQIELFFAIGLKILTYSHTTKFWTRPN